MALCRIQGNSLTQIPATQYALEDLKERADLQALLRDHPEAIELGLFVIAEEYGEWEESRRRIDLLALDSEGQIVVIELKRTDDGGFMDLQAVRYAAMVAGMTFDDMVRAHDAYVKARHIDEEAKNRLLSFLGTDEESVAGVIGGGSPRIILMSAGFSRELTTAVLWLIDKGIDIRCVEMRPYRLGDDVLIDMTQVIPLAQASDYQVRIRRQAAAAVGVAREATRRERTVRILWRNNVIKGGDVIRLILPYIGLDETGSDDPMFRARFAGDPLNQ